MVAHNAPFDRRVLRQAFDRIGLDWPNPPVLCTAALARTLLPLQRRARPAARSPTRSGSRSTSCTGRWRTPRRARGCCARCSRGCAPTRSRSATRWRCWRHDGGGGPSRRRSGWRPRRPSPSSPSSTSPSSRATPACTCSATARARPVRRQVGVDPQPGPGALRALEPAGRLDRARRDRRLPDDALRARRAGPREPADQGAAAARQHDAWSAATTGCATSAAGSTSRSRSSRCRPSRRRAMRSRSARCAVGAWRVELVEQLDSLFGLRHCGRRLPAARTPVRVRADGPLPVAVPGRPGPEPLPPAAGRGAAAVRRRRRGRAPG